MSSLCYITNYLMTGHSGKKFILFPSNLNVSLGSASGNIEILGKQNELFPSGPVIKCLVSECYLFRNKPTRAHEVDFVIGNRRD